MHFYADQVRRRAPHIYEAMSSIVRHDAPGRSVFMVGREIEDGLVEVSLKDMWHQQCCCTMRWPITEVVKMAESLDELSLIIDPLDDHQALIADPVVINQSPRLIFRNRWFKQLVLAYDEEQVMFLTKSGAINQTRRWCVELPDVESDLRLWNRQLLDSMTSRESTHTRYVLENYLRQHNL